VLQAEDEWGRKNGIVQVAMHRPRRLPLLRSLPDGFAGMHVSVPALRSSPADHARYIVTSLRESLDALGAAP
jgi:hypothetical protein